MLQKGKTKMDLDKISKKLEKKLKPDRYRHTKGVMYTAAAMAMRYEQDIQEAMLAGLLHDCGKFTSPEEQVELCKKYKIELSEAELQVLPLIHAKLGAYLAKEKYKVDNERVINAILYHTTGRPNMTMLDKIIYLFENFSISLQNILILLHPYTFLLHLHELSFHPHQNQALLLIFFPVLNIIFEYILRSFLKLF